MKGFKKAIALLLALCLVIQPMTAFAATATPDGGSTSGAPFIKGTADSNSFRIPSLVTLSDGTLVAAADARWNTTYDGGGLDTIVSTSTDDGATWNYTFANYLGDNENEYNGSSTCFIDPAMAVTSDDTIYMLVDLYPYGVALNGNKETTPATTKGFDDQGRLLLRDTNSSSYGYYLYEGKIYSTSGVEQSGYEVDEHFNITGTDGTDSNLFFSDSPFKVVRTGFLYLTKSTDKGKTWSAPTLLDLKTTSEMVCLVGPGRGLVTSDGMIVFPCYSYNGSQESQQTSFIYSTNDGSTWNRSASYTGATWSSEAAVVELADGTLRFFYRNGTTNLCYADYNVTTNTWGTQVNTGLKTNSNCQISAITYSKTVGGKQVILVSCPTGPNSAGSDQSGAGYRLNGKIFVGLVNSDDNKTISWQTDKTISVDSKNNSTTNYFMYSCLTELKDGKIAILYEDNESNWGTGDNSYYQMSYATYAFPLTADSSDSGSSGDSSGGETGDDTQDNTQESTLPEEYAGTIITGTIQGESYWQLVTDGVNGIESGKKYLIASGSSGNVRLLTNAGGRSSAVTVTDSKIATADTAYQFTLEASGDSWTIKDTDGTYLYPTATRSYYNWSRSIASKQTSPQTVTISGTNSVSISRSVTSGSSSTTSKISYSNNSGFGASQSGSSLYLFEEVSVPGGTSYEVDLAGINALINVVPAEQNLYTDETWTAFQNALTVANTAVADTADSYATEAEAKTQQDAVNNAALALYNAWNNLKEYNQIEITVNYQAGGVTVKTETIKVLETATSIELDSNIYGSDDKTYSVNDTTLNLVAGNTVYNVAVTELEGTPVSIKENEDKEISVTLKDGQYVEWSTDDSSYVGVAGKYDSDAGAYTDAAVIIGHNVTDSPVVVTGTIYNADGTKTGTQKWLVTVTEGDADTNTYEKHIYVNVTAIENCTAYYSVNGGELIKVNGTGIIVDEDITGLYNIMFFAAPDEGYALTYMSVSGTAKQYYTLSNGNPDGTGSDAWPFDSATQTTIPSTSGDSAWVDGHGFRWPLLEGNMGIEQMKLLFSNAIALGCDGVASFTKNGDAGFYTEVQFAAQKLPTLDKKIVSITRENGDVDTYSEGMKVSIGDTINYEIEIQEYAEKTGPIATDDEYTVTSPITTTNKPTYETGSYGTITYTTSDDALVNSFVTLEDSLTGDQWNPDLGTSSTTSSVHTFETDLKLTTDNFNKVVEDGKITNTANLKYDYTSQYSTGTLNASASAAAEITVEVPYYVIDFGLPVEFDLSELGVVSGNIKSATATYGNAVASGTTVTYTPNRVLLGTDYINLTYENGKTYAIAVYPATTVYYEEGFAIGSKGDWASFSKTTSLKQLAERVAAKTNVYGFDSAYTGVGPSNGTQAESDEASIGTVTFTGTGVDIYTNNTTESGVLMAWVKNSAGNTVKVVQVDTHMEKGDNSYTSEQGVNAYNVPVVSIAGLDRGSYTVELRHIGQSVKDENGTSKVVYKPVALDGYRVHGTIDYATDAYVKDLEDNPTFIEVRDKVLAGLNVATTGSEYAEDIAKDALAQVYATAQSTEGAVVLSSYGGTDTANVDIQDLLDNGPKNELYLRQGESVVFSVTTNRVTQIGLKALDKSVTNLSVLADGTAVEGAPTSLSTSTDMFYKIADEKTAEETVTYTITNNGGGILSITELKICDDPNATFGELEAADLIPALGTLGYETESSEPTPEPGTPDTPTEPGTPETPVVPEEPGTPDEPTQEPEHECTIEEEIVPATTMKAGKIINKCKECGEVESTKIIYKASNVKLANKEFVYNGKVKAPKLIVKDSKGKVIDKKYYTVIKPAGRKNVGKYTYTIKFKGLYEGTKKLTLTVKPKATAVKSVTASKKAFTVKWNKVSKQATGYEIMYATNAKFSKGKHTVKVTKLNTTSKKISKLKAKQKYYVKVRTYKTVKVNGKNTKIYSNWSKYRTVTTKR